MTTDRIRAEFEAWISAPPFEHMCDRNSEKSAWPGSYKRYETELAWEAWQAAASAEREACAKVCEEASETFWREHFIDAEHAGEKCDKAIRARSV